MASRNPYPTATSFLPPRRTLASLRAAVPACRGCDLYEHATQAVFGAGPASARVVMVGEQPGDAEDRAGAPFVGPAGRLLDEAMTAAALPRDQVYVTNAVKHFKYTQRGKRRIHDKPTYYQTQACRPWLDAELAALDVEVLILLGATAAQALLGRAFRVTQHRGEVMPTPFAPATICTVHPASVLRAPDDDAREQARLAFFADVLTAADCWRGRVRIGRDAQPGA